MNIRYDKGDDRVGFSLFYRGEWTDNSASASILSGQRWRRLREIRFDKRWLKPLDSKGYIAYNATKAFTRGTKISISVKNAGKNYDFTYSLKGYSAANRAANRHCGARASWTVK